MKFRILTYGCQMNEYESLRLKEFFESIGFIEAASLEDADFVFLNSCAVRQKSEDKLYSAVGMIRSLYKKKGNPFSIVSGCVATISEKRIRRIGDDSVHLILKGTESLREKKEILKRFFQETSFNEEFYSNETKEGIFAYVPVIFGCDSFCSYCIVPAAKGRERSRTIDEVSNEINGLIKKGVKEIILLGQNINHYGKDLGMENGFIELLESVDKIEGLERMRFLTSHPADFRIDILDRMLVLKHLMPHFHLPVQSGNNRILKLMKRDYTREYYIELVREIRNRFKDVSITTDIIVGFPTETYDEYLDTERLVKEIKFDKSFIAAYSKRGKTPASLMEGQVEEDEKKKRLNQLLLIQNEISRNINRKSIGKVTEILIENSSNGRVFGRTPQDKLVIAEGESKASYLAKVIIKDADENHLKGVVLE